MLKNMVSSEVDCSRRCVMCLVLGKLVYGHRSGADNLVSMGDGGFTSVEGPALPNGAGTTSHRRERVAVDPDHADKPRLPATSEIRAIRTGDDLRPGVADMSSVQPNILLLQLEFPTWATARPWTNFAVQEGLEAAGAQCSTVPVIAEVSCASPRSWVYHARQLLAGRTFDQVWVWLVHAPLDPSTLEWIAGLAPVRVGIIMESLRYAPNDDAWAPHLQERQRHVEEQIGYMTHVLTFDQRDAEDLNLRRVAKALWWPPMVCERFITAPSIDPSHPQAVFHGTPYGPRQRWIGNPLLRDRLAYHQSGPPTQYQRLFDQLQQQAGTCIGQGGVNEALIRHYVQTWRTIRLGEFQEWMAGLAQWPAIVNLPTLAKFYGGRVFEGMAAGRPVISWKIDERPKNLALFEDGRDILLFPPDDPHALSRHIDRLRHDPSLAHSIAANAHHKLRAFHTAERRLCETLSWIGTGIEPSYGLASAPPQQNVSATAMPMRDGTASRGSSSSRHINVPLLKRGRMGNGRHSTWMSKPRSSYSRWATTYLSLARRLLLRNSPADSYWRSSVMSVRSARPPRK